MRIQEMRQREDIDTILRTTLSTAWSAMLGTPIKVVDLNTPGSQPWQTHRLLGGFFTATPSPAVRHFLRDGFRGTPVRRRIVPQWILGTQLSTKMGLWATSTPAFGVVGLPQNADALLILPGNQRIRIFDFDKGIVRVILKDGFSSRTMKTEISVRNSNADRSFMVSIDAQAPDASWFEEKIIPGYALPRCPPWYPKSQLTNQAMTLLATWSQTTAKSVAPKEYVDTLRTACETTTNAVIKRYSDPTLELLPILIESLCKEAAEIDELFVGPSHGDFQSGNILVSRNHVIRIIDWEHSTDRSILYDKFVLELGTRSPAGLADRWAAFLEDTLDSDILRALPRNREWRRQATSLVALEDLLWYLRESLSGPYFSPSAGLLLLISALKSGVLFKVGAP